MTYRYYFFLTTAYFSLLTPLLFSFNPDHLAYALEDRCNLQNLDLSEADLSGQNFRLADLSYTNLSGTNLTNTDFSYAQFFRTKLHSANMAGANFFRAQLESVDLCTTNWQVALNLSKATIGRRVRIDFYSSSSSTHHPNYANSTATIDTEDQEEKTDAVYQSKKCTTPPVVVYYETACPICSKSYTTDEEIVALPCGHTMCHHNPETKEQGCIFELIAKYGKKCPLCKKQFSNYACIRYPKSSSEKPN